VLKPSAGAKLQSTDRSNALALEGALSSLGVGVRRGAQTIAPTVTATGNNHCSALVDLTVPAPAAGAKPVRRKFRMRGHDVAGHADADALILECYR